MTNQHTTALANADTVLALSHKRQGDVVLYSLHTGQEEPIDDGYLVYLPDALARFKDTDYDGKLILQLASWFQNLPSRKSARTGKIERPLVAVSTECAGPNECVAYVRAMIRVDTEAEAREIARAWKTDAYAVAEQLLLAA